MTSVKSKALSLIKHYTLENDYYEIALNKLKAKYLNPEVVKHTLLQNILNFKCDTKLFTKIESLVNKWSTELVELRNVHNLDVGADLCKELLREILFYRLPADVRIGLIDECGTNYPPLDSILDKFDKVLTRLKIGKDIQNSESPLPIPESGISDPNV